MQATYRKTAVVGAWRPRVRQATAILGALAVVGVVWFNRERLSGAPLIPNSPETETYWFCHACNHGFALSARDYSSKVAYFVPDDAGTDGAKHRIEHLRATTPCPQCGGPAVSARRCLADGAIFDTRPPGGAAATCPKCGAKVD